MASNEERQNLSRHVMGRRTLFAISAAGLTGLVAWLHSEFPGESDQPPPGPPKIVSIVDFTAAGVRLGVTEVPQILKSDREWRRQLGYMAYRVTRKSATELPYSGAYWKHHEPGLYRCICCATALFSSETKFDSGTGWPSFWRPIAKENITTSDDRSFGAVRTAVSCRRCDAHLGHVFEDGPDPTGLRYCMNSVSLTFEKAVVNHGRLHIQSHI